MLRPSAAGMRTTVRHDREFLDNVVTSTVVFENDGSIQDYVGGYSDWLRQGHQLAETDSPIEIEARKREVAERRKQKAPTKLSYKDQRELQQLPGEIDALEKSVAALQEAASESEFYAQDSDVVQQTLKDLADQQASLEQKIDRWSELESFQTTT